MFNGGYKIIDLGDANFTVGTEKTIAGVYDAIEENYRRPILLQGLQVGSKEKQDRFVTFNVSGTSFVATVEVTASSASAAKLLVMTVADDDGITFSETSLS